MIGLIIGIALKNGKTEYIYSCAPAKGVSQDQLVNVDVYYYGSKIDEPLKFQNTRDHLDSKYYAMPDFYNMESNGSLKIFSHFKTLQQSSIYTDMVSIINMLRSYFDQPTLNETYLGELVDCGSDIHENKYGIEGGTRPDQLEEGLNILGYTTDSNRKYASPANYPFHDYVTFRDWIMKSIDEGNPIIILHLDWGTHFLVPIGIDTMGTDETNDDILIVADTYDTTDHRQDGYVVWSLERFYDLWEIKSPYFQDMDVMQFIQVMNPNH